MAINEKLKTRAEIKSRKPTFTRRQGIRQFSKLKKSGWRAPKGMGNKQRRGRKGQPIKPSCGFGSPKEVKGLDKNGLLEVLVNNVNDFKKVESKTQIAVISSNVGGKKRLEILNLAKIKKLAISNVKDLDNAIESLKKNNKKKSESKKVESKKETSTGRPTDVSKKETKIESKLKNKTDSKSESKKKEEAKK